MGFCFSYNLEIQEWIILIIFTILMFIAVWNDRREGKWEKLKNELAKKKKVSGKEQDRKGIDKWLYRIQKILDYFSGGLFIRQILNPYILFPFFVLLFWLLKINDVKTGDLVLTLTLAAIVWYSRETLVLRQEQWKSNKIAKELMEEQKKLVYLQALEMEMKDKDSGYKARIKYPLIVRRIIEKGEFDPKELYSNDWHQDI